MVGFVLRSGSVLRTLPEGECEAEPPTHMSISHVDRYMYSAAHVSSPVAVLAQALLVDEKDSSALFISHGSGAVGNDPSVA